MKMMKLLVAIMIIATAQATEVYAAGNKDGGKKTILLMNSKFEIDEGLKAAAAYYEQQNPEVSINVVSAVDAPGSPEIKARFAGGEAPDIFALQGGNQLPVWETYLEDLSGESWVGSMAPMAKPAITMNGKIYGWPLCVEGGAYMYNKRMFREAGITELPKTRSQFADAIAKLKRAGFTPLTEDGGWYALASYWVNYGFTGQSDPLAFIQGLNNGSQRITGNAKFKESAEFIQWETSQMENRLAIDFQVAVSQFANEEAAITWGGNWNQLTITQIKPNIEMGLMPVPVFADTAANDYLVGIVQYWCVNKNSKVKEEAKAFLSWLCGTKEGQGFLVKDMALIPAFTTFKADPNGSGILGKEFSDYMAAGKVKSIYIPYYPDGGLKEFGDAAQKLVAGQATPDQYLQDLQSAWDRLK
jgi:raffinose/stachyose/melibiose transport system substrate-binding protein